MLIWFFLHCNIEKTKSTKVLTCPFSQVTTSTVGDRSRVLNAREKTDPKRKRRMGLQGLCRDPVDSTGLCIIPPAPFFSSSVVWKRERDLWLPTSSYNLKCWRWSQSPKHKRKMGLQGLSTALWTQQPNRAVDKPSSPILQSLRPQE